MQAVLGSLSLCGFSEEGSVPWVLFAMLSLVSPFPNQVETTPMWQRSLEDWWGRSVLTHVHTLTVPRGFFLPKEMYMCILPRSVETLLFICIMLCMSCECDNKDVCLSDCVFVLCVFTGFCCSGVQCWSCIQQLWLWSHLPSLTMSCSLPSQTACLHTSPPDSSRPPVSVSTTNTSQTAHEAVITIHSSTLIWHLCCLIISCKT